MKLQLSVFGDEQIERELLRFSEYAGNPQPAFLQIADDIRDSIEPEQFASEGGRGSGGWAPLKPDTIAAKAAEGLHPEILQATQRLYKSLTERGGDHVEEISDQEVVVGSRVPYGGFHQKGTSKMPARKPVELTELDRRGFVRTLQRYVVEGVL